MNEGKEIGEHSPDAYWQNWTKQNLGNDIYITDIDNCIRSKDGQVIIVELKRYAATMPTSQRITYNLLSRILQDANGKTYPININGYNTTTTIDFRGFFLIQFERTSFEDGRVYVNGIEKTEKQVIDLLSFKPDNSEKQESSPKGLGIY